MCTFEVTPPSSAAGVTDQKQLLLTQQSLRQFRVKHLNLPDPQTLKSCVCIS